jgi:hypothetical protein
MNNRIFVLFMAAFNHSSTFCGIKQDINPVPGVGQNTLRSGPNQVAKHNTSSE